MPVPSETSVFRRFGWAYHLQIETVEDLHHVLHLDSAHWVATSAILTTINLDPIFLARLDANHDGHIRAEEVRTAIRHLFDLLRDTGDVQSGNTILRLEALNDQHPRGRLVLETARKILERLGTPNTSTLTLAQVREVKEHEKKRGLSEAGLVLPEAATEAHLQSFFADILATVGGTPHSEGAAAVSAQRMTLFLEQVRAYLAWRHQITLGQPSKKLPLGDATAEAYQRVAALAEKLDQYFTLCETLRLQPNLAHELWPDPVDLSESTSLQAFLNEAPLAPLHPKGVLDFAGPVNPSYADALADFRTAVVERLLDEPATTLSITQWTSVKSTFAPYRTWLKQEPDVQVRDLPLEKLQRYADDPFFEEATQALIAKSHKAAVELDDVRLVEQAILYQAYLLPFVNSFVSFPELYNPKGRALFEMGTLVMDGRHFTLSVKVTNRTQHIQFSNASNMFVLYVSVRDKEGEEKYEVAVPVTYGGRGNLQVGKRGVFYDIDGKENHAQVVHIVENPISLREAIMRPFIRLGEAINNMIERMGAQREKTFTESGQQVVQDLATAPETQAPPVSPTAATVAQSPAGLLAGGAVAVAALGSSLAFVTKTLEGLEWQALVGSLVGAVLAVMIPVVLVAYFRLRRRDLSAMLEGSDWAINARMRLTRSQARTFAHTPPYPAGARGIGVRRWRIWIVLIVLAVATYYFIARSFIA